MCFECNHPMSPFLDLDTDTDQSRPSYLATPRHTEMLLLAAVAAAALALAPDHAAGVASVPQLQFAILPANRTAPAVRWGGGWSWGVAAAKSDDPSDPTPYHAFVDGAVGDCGLGSWATNSEVWHAVSRSPRGPCYDIIVAETGLIGCRGRNRWE